MDKLLNYFSRVLLRALGGSVMGKYAKCIGSKMKAGKSMKGAHAACRGAKHKKKGR